MAALFITTAKEDVRRSSIKTEKLHIWWRMGKEGQVKREQDFHSSHSTLRHVHNVT